MTNMNDSQEKFNEEMTRHGILKDIKGIDQTYDTSPGRVEQMSGPYSSAILPNNRVTENSYATTAQNSKAAGSRQTVILLSKLGGNASFLSKRAASPPLPQNTLG